VAAALYRCLDKLLAHKAALFPKPVGGAAKSFWSNEPKDFNKYNDFNFR
jgi:hypothetical protein